MRSKPLLVKTERFIAFRLLHVDDSPHRIALGVGVGLLVAWTPTIGLQSLLVLGLAALLRANKAVGLPLVWISNPLTIVPIYGPNYLVGNWLLGRHFAFAGFRGAVERALADSGSWWQHVCTWWSVMAPFLAPLWVGSLVVGMVMGIAGYSVTYFVVTQLRRVKHYRQLRRQQRRLMRPACASPAEPADEQSAGLDVPAERGES